MPHAYLFASIKIRRKKNKNATQLETIFLPGGKKSKLGSFWLFFFFSVFTSTVVLSNRFFVDENLSSQSVASFVRIYFRRIDGASAVKRGNKKNSSGSLTILLAEAVLHSLVCGPSELNRIPLFPSISFYFSFVPLRIFACALIITTETAACLVTISYFLRKCIGKVFPRFFTRESAKIQILREMCFAQKIVRTRRKNPSLFFRRNYILIFFDF